MLKSWMEGFIAECAAFPNGANDDQVDAWSRGAKRFTHILQFSFSAPMEGTVASKVLKATSTQQLFEALTSALPATFASPSEAARWALAETRGARTDFADRLSASFTFGGAAFALSFRILPLGR